MRNERVTRKVQASRDSLNLTTLIRWAARHGGSFRFFRDDEKNWQVEVLRKGVGITQGTAEDDWIVFSGAHEDISTIVHRAAGAIKRTPEWTRYDARRDWQGGSGESSGSGSGGGEAAVDGEVIGEAVEYDFDIWNSKRDQEPLKRGDYGTVGG